MEIATQQQRHRSRRVARSRPYAPEPPRIPDDARFREVAEENSPLWEITYASGTRTPYRARHRVAGFLLACSDLEVFAHVVRLTEPPSYVRPYLGASHTAHDEQREVSHA